MHTSKKFSQIEVSLHTNWVLVDILPRFYILVIIGHWTKGTLPSNKWHKLDKTHLLAHTDACTWLNKSLCPGLILVSVWSLSKIPHPGPVVNTRSYLHTHHQRMLLPSKLKNAIFLIKSLSGAKTVNTTCELCWHFLIVDCVTMKDWARGKETTNSWHFSDYFKQILLLSLPLPIFKN